MIIMVVRIINFMVRMIKAHSFLAPFKCRFEAGEGTMRHDSVIAIFESLLCTVTNLTILAIAQRLPLKAWGDCDRLLLFTTMNNIALLVILLV